MAAAALACTAGMMAPSAFASVVTIDFNGVPTGGTFATDGPVTSYLAGFGVTTSDTVYVYNTGTYLNWVASPTLNVFTGSNGLRNPTSFSFSFSAPVDDLSFVRSGRVGAHSPSGSINGPWTATAYDASNHALASAGEGLISQYGDIASASFALNAFGIDHVTFVASDLGYAGVAIPMITDISFTRSATVPEPGTYALLLLGLALLGFVTRSRLQKASAQSGRTMELGISAAS
jgi:hypothetical protein